LFVVEQRGVIQIIDGQTVTGPAFLGIADRVRDEGGEQGLLGLAFHPAFATNGRFFVHYSAEESAAGAGASVIAEFTVSSTDPNLADPTSERRLLEVAQPFSNHNAGMLAFSPADGFLYVGMGDGGSGGDPRENGEDTSTLLGSLLRLGVDGPAPYGIPQGNPFEGSPNGTLDPRPEIWAFGLRNPWRFSFDAANGDLYIGDVGQGSFEEIDYQPATSVGGENYGWNTMEGRACFDPEVGCDETGRVLPVSVYGRDAGCSVTGGYVYRGTCMTDMVGEYVFGDYCTDTAWAANLAGIQNDAPRDISQGFGASINGGSSFGEGANREIFVTSLRSGEVFQLVLASE